MMVSAVYHISLVPVYSPTLPRMTWCGSPRSLCTCSGDIPVLMRDTSRSSILPHPVRASRMPSTAAAAPRGARFGMCVSDQVDNKVARTLETHHLAAKQDIHNAVNARLDRFVKPVWQRAPSAEVREIELLARGQGQVIQCR